MKHAAMLALGILIGWVGARQIVPTPEIVLLSPRVQCGGAHEVSVPMVENLRWAVQSGAKWWGLRGWGGKADARWHLAPGREIVSSAPEGVRLVVAGFQTGNISGSLIRAVKIEEKENKS